MRHFFLSLWSSSPKFFVNFCRHNAWALLVTLATLTILKARAFDSRSPRNKINDEGKWLNLPFIRYLLLYMYWCYHPQNVFGKTKVYLLWETKMFLMGNQKWQKNLNLKSWKSQTLIFGFVIFGFPLKKYFFSEQTYFCPTKKKFGLIASIEKKRYYKR